MESFFARYRNPMILGGVLLLQLLGLAVQVRRPLDPQHPDSGSIRLIRLWMLGVATPIESGFSAVGHGFRQLWHDYVNVTGLRHENESLRADNERLRLEEIHMAQDAAQAHRLQGLLDFKEHFPSHTLAAQVIGSSGSEQSRVLYIDKGARDGVLPDMAVITADGVVGKVRDVFRGSAQVLLINDEMSGVGALLEKSRLFGVVKGSAGGTLMLDHIMSDEKVEKGEPVVTSGGDRIFPKGLPVGTIADVSPGSDLFLNIRVRPAADLSRLEEVLVVTDVSAVQTDNTPVRAADILAQRLPTVEPKPADDKNAGTTSNSKPAATLPRPQSQVSVAQRAASEKAAAGTSTAKMAAVENAAVKPKQEPEKTIVKKSNIVPAANAPAQQKKITTPQAIQSPASAQPDQTPVPQGNTPQ
jgi:rod shape-determining protein MreC